MRAQSLDALIEGLILHKKILCESEFQALAVQLKYVLITEPNLLRVAFPAVVVSDIHGQAQDLHQLLRLAGVLTPELRLTDSLARGESLVFLGDYCDRGHESVEVWQLLMLLKLKFPTAVALLRGNHESGISAIYGYKEEVLMKYGNTTVWRLTCELFDLLPLAAVVGDQVFAVHGGLSPAISRVSQIQLIDRFKEIPPEGPMADLMWSDPEESLPSHWLQNPRGAGWIFGASPTREFLHLNGLSLVARGHQLVNEGFKYMFTSPLDLQQIPGAKEGLLVTVWSAPNYCYRCGNIASILAFDQHGNREFKIFTESQVIPPAPKDVVPYFV